MLYKKRRQNATLKDFWILWNGGKIGRLKTTYFSYNMDIQTIVQNSYF